ncbi:uncharacterized protein MYCFIDRAFT_149003 [Pseudocercospora fijiensis CIRAD86]|uniref:PrpF protein n=1 Tax=Pseudocercospora fijiensis (strain CIRAD86) TaxID=383855 RepID=N1Q986_PSEFD|nr:uncharacterized protein MYCFIDRAFT_149003 [Pseudocercospora fijiensis CIRAD86]EME88351.1 hypothetical protein MYCFIDRAFT_149003 [Pseudocercospora fijiensis CIRAD86]
MRAGTSKGLFLHKRDLPAKQEQWSPIILAAMGSADSDPRQLNGIAGATSTTSKVAVVAASSKSGIDIEYTFIQVSIGSPQLDFTGNCGNIASGVGPFAIDEGLVQVPPGKETIDVRILNTNTGRVLVETLEIDRMGHFAEDGDYNLPGTFSTGSTIGVAFEKPAGAMTGSLLPSGNAIDSLCIPGTIGRPACVVQASLIDAANPFVLVEASSLPAVLHGKDPHSSFYLDFVEDVRRQGAVAMGLARDVQEAAKTRGTPKIAILSAANDPKTDLEVTAFSMGKVHGSLQLTGAVCLSTAVCTTGTVANRLLATRYQSATQVRNNCFVDLGTSERNVTIRHPSGTISAEVRVHGGEVATVRLVRTARRLFEGNVCFIA